MIFPETSPVVHNITNYVAMGISANALLALGASPLMSSAPEEMEDIASFAAAMVANLGCLESSQAEAMSIAAAAYHRLGKPWVLDPAGVGIGAFRREFALRLIAECRPTAIRGNASEIMVLAGKRTEPGGMDSHIADEEPGRVPGPDGREDSAEAAVCGSDGNTKVAGNVECAMELARQSGAIVVMSGKTDFITDGKEVWRVEGGSPRMAEVTAMGCTASAMVAAMMAENPDRMEAAKDAMLLMARAGEMADARSAGPGSFAVNFIDAIAAIRKNSASSQ